MIFAGFAMLPVVDAAGQKTGRQTVSHTLGLLTMSLFPAVCGLAGWNYFFAALAGTTWFLQFFFYGMGESKLGNGASSWILHMAFIILVANLWGFALKEWKGVSQKTKTTIIIGVVTIILSVMLVGYGNAIK